MFGHGPAILANLEDRGAGVAWVAASRECVERLEPVDFAGRDELIQSAIHRGSRGHTFTAEIFKYLVR